MRNTINTNTINIPLNLEYDDPTLLLSKLEELDTNIDGEHVIPPSIFKSIIQYLNTVKKNYEL